MECIVMYALLASLLVVGWPSTGLLAEDAPRLPYASVFADVGSNVTLPCNYKGVLTTAHWYNVSDRAQVPRYDEQKGLMASLSEGRARETCGLEIKNVGLDHAGFYKFINVTWNGHKGPEAIQYILVQLVVADSPSVDMASVWNAADSITIVGHIGDTVVLPCNIDSEERLWIRLKDSRLYAKHFPRDDRITNIKSGMRIDNVAPEDAAVYRCEITTDPTSVSFVTLEVEGYRSETKIEVEVVKRVKIDDTVVMSCYIEGLPLSISWYKDGERIIAEEREDMEIIANPRKSILTISKSGVEHSGNYMCVPYNGQTSSVDIEVTN